MSHRLLSFVGRDAELGALADALADAAKGRGGIWLLSGEPGIGKSRLCEEVARDASDGGFTVAWGRSWEAGGTPAFGPWLQALRALRRERGDEAFTPHIQRRLVTILPELATGDPTDSPGVGDPNAGRFQLLEAITTAVLELSMAQPILLVLEDLHAADHSTLTLVDFVSRQLLSAPVLVLGTLRERDARYGEHAPLLRRITQDAHTLSLGPLDRASVARYLTQTTGRQGEARALAEALYERTEGHPLFMVELVRLIASAPSVSADSLGQLDLPPGLEQALLSHVSTLRESDRTILEMAAVMGRELSTEALAHCFDRKPAEVSGALETASRLGLVLSIGPGCYRFSHVLFRDTLERDLDDDRRAELHRRIGEWLSGEHDVPWSEVAHHFVQAGPECVVQAIDALERTGEVAIARFAFEDAASAYAQALELCMGLAHGDPRHRGRLLLGLCRARMLGGKREEGRALCMEAASLARKLDDPALLAQAALELGSVLVFAQIDAELIALLREALAALPAGDSPLRALVQSRLAAAMQPAEDPAEPIELALDAIAMARRLGDQSTLLATLRSGCSTMVDLAAPEIRLELNREHARLASAAGETRDAIRAETRLIFDCFELGDRLGADAHVRAASRLIRDVDHPSVAWRLPAMEAMRHLWDGALEAALEACDRAAAIGIPSGDPNARTAAIYQRQRILRMLGRHQEMATGIADVRTLFAGTPSMHEYLQATTAAQLLVVGQRDAALSMVDDGSLHKLLRFGDRTVLEPLAEIALASANRGLAEKLSEHVAPLEHYFIGGGVLGMTWEGPMHRVLALSAQVLGDHQSAVSHFERGIEATRRIGGEPVATWMLGELGELLWTMSERKRARRLLDKAITEAESMSMASVAERALRRIEAEAATSSPTTAVPETSPPDGSVPSGLVLECSGDVWSVRMGEKVVRTKDTKGIRFIAALVAQPHQEMHVLDLASPAARKSADGDGGEIIDEAARDDYRTRIESLRAELEEAESWNDPARAEASRAELEMLTAELSRGLGLGGRSRRFAGNAERARINVQRRIRDAIKRIASHDEGIARHLERAVRTGMYCSYDPE